MVLGAIPIMLIHCARWTSGNPQFGNDDNPAWVHISYVSPDKNRNRCLKAYKEKGKTKYKVI